METPRRNSQACWMCQVALTERGISTLRGRLSVWNFPAAAKLKIAFSKVNCIATEIASERKAKGLSQSWLVVSKLLPMAA